MNTKKLVEEIEVVERMLAAIKHTIEMEMELDKGIGNPQIKAKWGLTESHNPQPILDIVRTLAMRQGQFTEQWIVQECLRYSHLNTRWSEVYAALLKLQSQGVIQWHEESGVWTVINPVPQPRQGVEYREVLG